MDLTESQKIFIDQCPTAWKLYWENFFYRLNNRPENQSLPNFADVEIKRQLQKMLHDAGVLDERRKSQKTIPFNRVPSREGDRFASMEKQLEQIVQRNERVDGVNANKKDRTRTLWNAAWHALGILKSEGDKAMKE